MPKNFEESTVVYLPQLKTYHDALLTRLAPGRITQKKNSDGDLVANMPLADLIESWKDGDRYYLESVDDGRLELTECADDGSCAIFESTSSGSLVRHTLSKVDEKEKFTVETGLDIVNLATSDTPGVGKVGSVSTAASAADQRIKIDSDGYLFAPNALSGGGSSIKYVNLTRDSDTGDYSLEDGVTYQTLLDDVNNGLIPVLVTTDTDEMSGGGKALFMFNLQTSNVLCFDGYNQSASRPGRYARINSKSKVILSVKPVPKNISNAQAEATEGTEVRRNSNGILCVPLASDQEAGVVAPYDSSTYVNADSYSISAFDTAFVTDKGYLICDTQKPLQVDPTDDKVWRPATIAPENKLKFTAETDVTSIKGYSTRQMAIVTQLTTSTQTTFGDTLFTVTTEQNKNFSYPKRLISSTENGSAFAIEATVSSKNPLTVNYQSMETIPRGTYDIHAVFYFNE